MSTERWVIAVVDHPCLFGYSAMRLEDAQDRADVAIAFRCVSRRAALLWFRRLNDMVAA